MFCWYLNLKKKQVGCHLFMTSLNINSYNRINKTEVHSRSELELTFYGIFFIIKLVAPGMHCNAIQTTGPGKPISGNFPTCPKHLRRSTQQLTIKFHRNRINDICDHAGQANIEQILIIFQINYNQNFKILKFNYLNLLDNKF